MRRILVILLWLLPTSIWAQTRTTVTGTVQGATSGYVEFQISPWSSSVQYYVQGGPVIANQSTRCSINSSGSVVGLGGVGTCQIWSNTLITPANTTYTVVYAPNNQITNRVPQQGITGTTYDLGSPRFVNPVKLVPQFNTVTTNPINANVTPAVDKAFNLGGTNQYYAAAYIDNLFVNTLGDVTTIDSKSYNGRLMCDQYTGADIGAKITNCLAAAPSTGTVLDATGIRGGTLSSAVVIDKPVALIMPSGGATVLAASITATANNVSIVCNSDTTLQRDSSFNSNVLIFSSTSGFSLQGCNLDGNKSNNTLVTMSMVIGVGASNCTISHNKFTNSPGQSIGLGGVVSMSVKSPSSHCIVEDNIISGSNNHSIDINGSNNIQVKHNEVYNSRTDGIWVGHGDVANVEVSGNIVHDNGGNTTTFDGHGIELCLCTLFGETVSWTGVNVVNNIVYKNYLGGIFNEGTTNTNIAANVTYNNNQKADHVTLYSGIMMETNGSAGPTGNNVVGNIAYDDQMTPTQDWGIREDQGTNNTYADNNLDGNRLGTINVVGTTSRVFNAETDGAGLTWFKMFSGGTNQSRLSVGSLNTFLDYNRLSAGNGALSLGANSYLVYDTSSTSWQLVVNNNVIGSFKHAGAGRDQWFIGPAANNFYFDSGTAGGVPTWIVDANDQVAYDRTNNRWQFGFNSVEGLRIEPTGITIPTGILTGNTPTVAASQIGLGANTTAAGAGACPSTITTNAGATAVAGCLNINVAGTARVVPFF